MDIKGRKTNKWETAYGLTRWEKPFYAVFCAVTIGALFAFKYVTYQAMLALEARHASEVQP